VRLVGHSKAAAQQRIRLQHACPQLVTHHLGVPVQGLRAPCLLSTGMPTKSACKGFQTVLILHNHHVQLQHHLCRMF
jgi:hypothetical protein